MRPLLILADISLAQRGFLFGWVPVCLGIGICVYFGLQGEPGPGAYAVIGLGAVSILLIVRWVPVSIRPLAVAFALVATGVCLAGLRAHSVAAPVLTFRYYGPVEGRVVTIDRSVSDAVRLTLDRVRLDRVRPERTPHRVRVALHGDQGFVDIVPGMTVILTGHLSPPAGPVEPGGFDFQRNAWFDRLGAVGYTRTPVLGLENGDGTAGLWIYRTRMTLSRAMQAALPGEVGAFAAAITTGDRSGMGQDTLADLRASNLAHLLAISGLHMGLLTGFIFLAMRVMLVAVGRRTIGWPVKKVAAVVALAAGAAYLALSGMNVATERAFLMVSVMFGAVLLDRRALTLRAVAMAAIVVLIFQPEEVMGPGFQMSFAATTALVAVFGALRGREAAWLPRWTRPVVAVVASSLIAGLGTAPFAAAHFNQVSHYGLLANVLSVPVMGAVVMPAAVLAACLAPFGLEWLALWVMDLGLRWILAVAHWVAGMEGAVSHVVSPQGAVLPILTLGALWMVLIQGRVRFAGAGAILVALVLWTGATRPELLVSDSGGLMGVMTPQGRALSREKGEGFAADSWLENDGGPVPQATAAARDGFVREGKSVRVDVGGVAVLLVTGKTSLAALDGCAGADVLVTDQRDLLARDRPCAVYDAVRLRETGALAYWTEDGVARLRTAHDVTGDRLWNGGVPPRTGGIVIARGNPQPGQ